MKTVILDAGHGFNTAGKRSPEGFLCPQGEHALYEWGFNRDIQNRVVSLLTKASLNFIILTPEPLDIPLLARANRANVFYEYNKDSFLVSIHANAGGGTGWEAFTSKGDTKSDEIANIFYAEADKSFPEFRIRKDYSDGDIDKESNFYILKNTHCPAILTENFFMDTEKDLKFITSNEGRQRIAQQHFNAIERVFKELY